MTIWALADLHLSFGTPQKKMDIFGPHWENHAEKIARNWKQVVNPQDLVLIAGDISWAMRESQILPDLEWLESLPGTKVMIRGNHDYWWQSISKVRKLLPPSCHAIQNDVFLWEGSAVGGVRLWESPETAWNGLPKEEEERVEDERIFERELHRLEMSLQALPQEGYTKIVMTHYPPIKPELEIPSRVSTLLESYGVQICVFGHVHNLKDVKTILGQRGGVKYFLTACDALNFHPLKIL